MIKKLFLGLFLLVCLVGTISAFNWSDQTIYYYRLDETTGTNTIDEIGNNNGTATNSNIFTTAITGVLNTSADFSGGNTWIRFGDVSEVDTFTNLSISAWVNFTSFATRQTILGKTDAGVADDQVFTLELITSDWFQFMFRTINDVTQSIRIDPDVYMNTNTLYHIVGVVNQTNISIYINETLINSSPRNDVGVLNPNAKNLTFGRYGEHADFYFGGTLDEVGIWNRSLSASEVSELYNSGNGLNFSFPVEQALEVELLAPTNNTITNEDTINFTTTLTPGDFNTTNATLFIWRDNGTIFNQTTNSSINTGDPINVSFSISNFTTDHYFWNVFACRGDGIGNNCTFADENFTLDWVPFSVDNEDFTNLPYETDDEFFGINITTDSTVINIGAFLIYNGTSHAANHVCSSGSCRITKTIDIPLVTTGLPYENKSFNWRITLFGNFGTFSTSTSANEQNVTAINISSCGGGAPAVNFTIFNETTLGTIFADFDSTFNFYLGSGTVVDSYNFSSSGASSYDFCIDVNETFITNSQIRIENGTLRSYTFRRELYTNSTTQKELFIPDTDTSNIIVTVKDQGLIPLRDYLVEISRFYESQNAYKMVESEVTDEFGQFSAKLIENDARYRFQFYNPSKTLVKTSELISINCRTAICFLPFVIEGENQYFERYENLTLLSYSLTFDNTTNIFTFSWDDQREEDSRMRLEIIRYKTNGSTVVCNSTSTATVSALTCNVGSQDATYRAQIFRQVTGDDELRLALLYVEIGGAFTIFGTEGLLWVFILLFTTIGIGAFNPSVGAALYGVGFTFMGLIGIISMPLPVFFANALIVVLFIWAVRT